MNDLWDFASNKWDTITALVVGLWAYVTERGKRKQESARSETDNFAAIIETYTETVAAFRADSQLVRAHHKEELEDLRRTVEGLKAEIEELKRTNHTEIESLKKNYERKMVEQREMYEEQLAALTQEVEVLREELSRYKPVPRKKTENRQPPAGD